MLDILDKCWHYKDTSQQIYKMLGLTSRNLFNHLYSRLNRLYSSSNELVFDHIIIGSGSAGSILARTLSDAGKTVAVFQAGGSNDEYSIHQYNQQPISEGKYVWNYQSIPQAGMNNRKIKYPVGQVEGGSSSINGMVWVHGCSKDYDDWGQSLWSSSIIKNTIKQIQNYPLGNALYRGHRSPSNPNSNLTEITTKYSTSTMSNMLVLAATSAGVFPNYDYNGQNQYGVCLNQLNVSDGQNGSKPEYRQDAYSIYVRPNPKILTFTNCLIQTIALEGSSPKAVGVNYVNANKQRLFARSKSSVYLCAGTFGSPYLLMKSGIGDPAELSKAKIQVKVSLPSVGKNLHDHTIATCARQITGSSIPDPNFSMQNTIFLRDSLKPFTGQPLYQMQSFYLKKSYWWDHKTSIGLGVLNLHPKSRGKVGLNQSGQVTIDPACFADPSDMDLQIKGLQLGRKILNKLKQLNPNAIGDEVWPEKGISVQEFIRQKCDIDYHPVGSCKLGQVVSNRLEVIGVENLKVADASVIPKLISGNTNAITMAIGLRAGQLEIGGQ